MHAEGTLEAPALAAITGNEDSPAVHRPSSESTEGGEIMKCFFVLSHSVLGSLI